MPTLLPGLCVHELVGQPRGSFTLAQAISVISRLVVIGPWVEFDGMVAQQRHDVEEFLKGLGCGSLSGSGSSSCSGSFQDRNCGLEICQNIAIYKGNIRAMDEKPSEEDVAQESRGGLKALLTLADDLDKNDVNRRKMGAGRNAAPRGHPACFPDFIVMYENTDAINTFVEMKRPSDKENELEPVHSSTEGKHVAEKYQKHFDKLAKKFRDGAEARPDWYHNALVQCIGYACCTDSGYGALYTHNSMFALRVIPTEFSPGDRDPQVTVEISKVYRCDDVNESGLHALLVLFRMARERGNPPTKKALVKLRTQIDSLRCKESRHGNYVLFDERSEARKRTGNGSHGSSAKHGHGSGKNRSGKQRHADVGTTASDTCTKEEPKHYLVYEEEMAHETEMVHQAVVDGRVLELVRADLYRLFLSHFTRRLGEGASGIADGVHVGGVDMVVKRWNWSTAEGLDELIHEMNVYKAIQKRAPNLFGETVPRLHAVVTEPREETALVMGLVGKSVESGVHMPIESAPEGGWEEDAWYVDGAKLDEEDVADISEAVMEGIRKLTNCWIYPSDVSSSNIRVERIGKGDGGSRRWRVWLLDFGRAIIGDVGEKRNNLVSIDKWTL